MTNRAELWSGQSGSNETYEEERPGQTDSRVSEYRSLCPLSQFKLFQVDRKWGKPPPPAVTNTPHEHTPVHETEKLSES